MADSVSLSHTWRWRSLFPILKGGMVQMTEKGAKALERGKLPLEELQSDPDFIKHRESVKSKKENEVELDKVNAENASPQDLIDSGFSDIEIEVKTDLASTNLQPGHLPIKESRGNNGCKTSEYWSSAGTTSF